MGIGISSYFQCLSYKADEHISVFRLVKLCVRDSGVRGGVDAGVFYDG
jgi:hypothetical protein